MNPFPALLFAAFGLSASVRADERAIVRIDDGDARHRQALGRHFGHLPRDRRSREIVLEVGRADWDWLVKHGHAPRFDAALSAQLQSELAKSIPGYGCYNTVEETDAFIADQVAAHPTLASAIDIGDSWERTASGGAPGYDLRVLRITNSAVAGDKPKMFIMSGLHAREYTPVQLNLKFADWLLSNYGSSAEATWLVDHNEFHLLLQANPDGRKIAESGLSQRKNRHDFGSCSGTGIGVDLNRNFPFYWNQVPGGSSGNLCSDTYRGPSAASEPETMAVDGYIATLFPDARTGPESSLDDPANPNMPGVYIDLHSYGPSVLYPWGVAYTTTGNDAAFKAMARRMAWFNDAEPVQSGPGLYTTDGASDDNAYGKLGVPAFTWELDNAFFESCTNFNADLAGNLDALRFTARILQAPYLRGGGPDVYAVSVLPAEVLEGELFTVTATVDDTRFNQSHGAEPSQNIASARVALFAPPFHPQAVQQALMPADGSFDGTIETVTGVIDTDALAPGRHLVHVSGTDASGSEGAVAVAWIVVRAAMLKDGFE